MSRKNKPSSVRHTRAVALDRSKRPTTAPPDEHIEARLHEVVHPATYSQLALFHQMGLRERTLSLPVMVAFVLSLIWRQVGAAKGGRPRPHARGIPLVGTRAGDPTGRQRAPAHVAGW